MAIVVADILLTIIRIAVLLIIARIVVDWVQVMARQWRPTGFVAVLLEVIYSITDPPLKAVGRVVKPIRLGGIMLDLSPMLLLVILLIAQALVVAILL